MSGATAKFCHAPRILGEPYFALPTWSHVPLLKSCLTYQRWKKQAIVQRKWVLSRTKLKKKSFQYIWWNKKETQQIKILCVQKMKLKGSMWEAYLWFNRTRTLAVNSEAALLIRCSYQIVFYFINHDVTTSACLFYILLIK